MHKKFTSKQYKSLRLNRSRRKIAVKVVEQQKKSSYRKIVSKSNISLPIVQKEKISIAARTFKRITVNSTRHRTKGFSVLFAFVSFVISTVFIVTTTLGLFFISYVQELDKSLPDIEQVLSENLAESTRIYDRKDRLLYTIYDDENREYIKLERVPEHTKWALLAAEDIDFYSHGGIDVQNILVALVDFINGKDLRGASTITQQLSRNVVLKRVVGIDDAYDRSLKRKLLEIITAIRIEEKLSKEEILELQMNEVFLGGTSFGFQTAAKSYFNKSVEQLTLAESAFLAGIVQSPTYYLNEIKNGNKEVVVKRRNDILDLMLRYSDKTKVTADDVANAKVEELTFKEGKIDLVAPHFVFYVVEQLEKIYGIDMVRSGGLRVKTTLDLDTQAAVETRLKEGISRFSGWYGVHNGAAVVIDPKNGEVLSMVGSVDYNNTWDKRVDGNVNVAVMPRQMGSSVKPYTYALAFRLGYTPGSPVLDSPAKYGNYRPQNWDNKFYGTMSIRTALNKSRNVPAVWLLNRIGGPQAFINEAERLGITTLTNKADYGLSITLGAGEMKLLEHTNAFGAFANSGTKYDPAVILEITDSRGKNLFKLDANKSAKTVYTPQEAYLMNWVLCQMGGRLDKSSAAMYRAQGQVICGKTGTTTGPKDLVMIGYYPKLIVGVWTGNNNGALTFGSRGQGWSENVPIVIVRNIMNDLVPRYGWEFYSQPADISTGYICQSNGRLAKKDDTCPKELTVYINSRKNSIPKK